MRFKSIINLLFVTGMMSYGVFSQVNSIRSSPTIEDAMICRFFKPQPPVQNDGGSRFAEPNTPKNQDNFPHVQA